MPSVAFYQDGDWLRCLPSGGCQQRSGITFEVNILYGDAPQYLGSDEARLAVDPSLDKTTYSLDVRRLKGKLRRYSFLLYILRE